MSYSTLTTQQRKYLSLLKADYPTREAVLTEIINLSAILELPKGTEHFMSDLHGEYEAFNHVMRNGSGSIRQKLRDCFPNQSSEWIQELATLIYYPTDKLQLEQQNRDPVSLDAWYESRIHRLIQVINFAGKKYTRSKMRKIFPAKYRYIIDELLAGLDDYQDRDNYYASIVETIIQLEQAPAFIRELAIVVQSLTVDHLHIVGDIYDRGPYPDRIMERLMQVRSLDIQWGNHDIIWLAIRAGSLISLVNVLRISARYNNLTIIEDQYGINLRPLIDYSLRHYTPQAAFAPKLMPGETISPDEEAMLNCLQQATFILQLKLEEALINRRPDFNMEDRRFLSRLDPDAHEVEIDGEIYPLVDFHAPTVNWEQPEQLTEEESQLLTLILRRFQQSEKFGRHMDFLLTKGAMYLTYNNNLLVHGCVPMHDDGTLKSFTIEGEAYAGRELFDYFDQKVRQACQTPNCHDDLATDLLWYLWCGPCSVLFGKHAMTTFERYYITDRRTHKEHKDPYYRLRQEEATCLFLLDHFGLPAHGHIINGHTPVKEKDGQWPIMANNRLVVIDGGFSKAYQPTTGIAGYTLLYNSYGMQLVAHEPFSSIERVVRDQIDVAGSRRLVEEVDVRTRVHQTNIGHRLQEEAEDLRQLYDYFDQID